MLKKYAQRIKWEIVEMKIYIWKSWSQAGASCHFHTSIEPWLTSHPEQEFISQKISSKNFIRLYTPGLSYFFLWGLVTVHFLSGGREPLTQNAASSWTWPFHNLSRNSGWWSLCMPYAKLKPRYGNYHILPEMGLHLYASYPLAFWPTNSIDSIALLRLSHQSDLVRGDLW